MNPSPAAICRASFLDLEFDRLDKAGAVKAVLALAEGESFAYLVTPNVDHLVRLHRQRADDRLWSAYRNADLCLCDSRILKTLARLSNVELELVTGSDLTATILESAELFEVAGVIGGDEQLLSDLRARYPAVRWLHHAAPHGIARNLAAQLDVARFVEGCSAGLVFFAVGSPQSELICALISNRGRAAGVGLCIGASLEFLTGAKTRAPRWMQNIGLEWLFRLSSEPRRLWRRYLVEGPAIFRFWWRWRVNSSR